MSETHTNSSSVEIFCSYAHEDEVWLRKLETHLSPLKQQGLISLWHDRLIVPGTDWAQAIDTHLETASVILLFISADFLASDYCYGIEMKRALERQKDSEALVIPVMVHQVDWTDTPFMHLQALPTDAQPLTIWQDEVMALDNVVAGIRRVIEELPLLAARAPRAALPAIWNIPYPRNPFFLGRDDELSRLRHHLQAGQAAALSQPQAISGLGGIGKTQLALEYAYRSYQDYQAVLWVQAESKKSLISSYVALATLLRLPEREAREQNVMVQAVKTWLQTHRDWLLILDNADELSLLPDYLPPTPGGHVLLTTRAAATGQLAHRLEIETLLPEQGALFLLRRAALLAPDATFEQASQQEWKLALQISKELGGLPLALDQAGAYLENTGIDLARYWHIYQQHQADLLRQRGELVSDHPAPVATTWSISFQKVEEKNPAAAELLRLCAYLAPDAIAEEILLQGVADTFLLNQAIEALRAYSLIRRDPEGRAISVHRLVQAVLKNEPGEVERRQRAERAVLAVNATFPESEYATWSQCERLLPHALLSAQLIATEQISCSEAGHLLHGTASYLRERARYQEAELLYQHARRIYEQVSGLEHPDTAATFHGLGILHRERGQYKEAEICLQQALTIREQVLGTEHPDTATTLHDLGGSHLAKGQYKEATSYLQRSLLIKEQVLGTRHPDTAATLHALGILRREQAQYKEATSYLQRSLLIKEQVLGTHHPDTATTLSALGFLYVKQGQYKEAETYLQRSLIIREQVQGANHPDTSDTLAALGAFYWRQGRYKEAEASLQRALIISEQMQGVNHPDTSGILHSLGLIYSSQGRYEEAENCYQQALSINQQVIVANHSLVGRVLEAYAFLLIKRRHPLRSASMYKQALKSLGLRRAINDAQELLCIYIRRAFQKK